MDQGFGLNLRGSFEGLQDCDGLWAQMTAAVDCADGVDPAALAERINRSANPVLVNLPLSTLIFGTVASAALDGAPSKPAAVRLSELLVRIKAAILSTALRSESDAATREAFLKDAARVLSVGALARTAMAATAAWDRPLSPPMRALIRKLARAATSPTDNGSAAEEVLRATIATRVDAGSVNGVGGFTRNMSNVRLAPKPQRRVSGRVTPEADRIVYMALEAGVTGDVVWTAVGEVLEQGRARELIDALKVAPDEAASAMVRHIANPTTLMTLLTEDPIDTDAVDLLLRPMGIAAAKPMLEVLAESRSRATRRAVLERLARLGPEISPLVETRLRDSRWFVVRNMLGLLREAGCTDSVRFAQRFMQHKDARVRREALTLLLQSPTLAEDALIAGLRDGEKIVLRAALQAARTRLPEAGVPILAQRVAEDITFPPEFRVVALHILGRAQSALALDALLRFAQNGRSVLGRPRLAAKSPEMIAALGGLARSWRHDRRARSLLDVAAKSRDPQIAGALHANREGVAA